MEDNILCPNCNNPIDTSKTYKDLLQSGVTIRCSKCKKVVYIKDNKAVSAFFAKSVRRYIGNF